MKPTPRWIHQYIRKVAPRLGLRAWEWTVTLVETIDRRDRTTIGRVFLKEGTLWAHIQLQEDVEADVEGYERLMHEILHVAFREEERRMDAVIAATPKRRRKAVRDTYWHAHEEQISTLAYWLSRRWRPKSVGAPSAKKQQKKKENARERKQSTLDGGLAAFGPTAVLSESGGGGNAVPPSLD